ncbi:hypothetical protein AB0C34_13595 [Nocardia sp. NPDC049220]|uniref:hypothetical protein n=1 Tax=Nocardia sp. NPDC049220 TaxID=3155273 RepID=UPI003410C754
MTSRTLMAWHNQPQLKAMAVEQMQRIAAYAGFRQGGQVLQDGRIGGGLHVCLCAQRLVEERGVSVSVVLAARATIFWLDESARLWGIPRVVGGLMDRCFERLPAREAGRFAVAAIEAIPVGADLDSVGAQWMLKLLADPREGVLRHTPDGSIQHRAVNRVIDLYRRALAGDDPAPAEWATAAQAAAQAAALADASEQAGPPACAARTANLAAVAFAHDLVPMQVQIAAIRSAATMPEVDAEAYQTAYIETEAFAQSAHYASETVRAAADASFKTMLGPLRQAAERALEAESNKRPPDLRDAAALEQIRDAADAAAAVCAHHYRWRADQLIDHVATAPQRE